MSHVHLAVQESDNRQEDLLSLLPPLPIPSPTKCRESCCGTLFCLFLFVVFNSVAFGVSFLAEGAPRGLQIATAILMPLLTVVVGLGSLAGLLFGDPGVVKRSQFTCLPIPDEIKARLTNTESLEGLRNINGEGQSYCVRCCVWRPTRSVHNVFLAAHHCNTCARCVLDFDHHCGVFGRCIAGTGLRGNMKYFVAINAVGGIASLYCLVCVITAIVFAQR